MGGRESIHTDSSLDVEGSVRTPMDLVGEEALLQMHPWVHRIRRSSIEVRWKHSEQCLAK
jgi:hypothetical protein